MDGRGLGTPLSPARLPAGEGGSSEGAYVIAAGGTGGHIFPGIALAREISARRPAASILFVGTGSELEKKLIGEAGFPLSLVRASGFAGKSPGPRLAALARLPLGLWDSLRLLRRHRARAVAGVGGYVTVPVLLAARLIGVPTLIHDSNATPGVANRFLNRFATRTAVGLAAANARLAHPGVVTGTPARTEFFAVSPLDPKAGTRRLLVFGGSQGARVLNQALEEALPALAAAGVEVVHQTGEKHFGDAPATPGVRRVPFLPRLYEELAWADLVVSRAGALTLAELAAAGRAAVLVPFGSATHAHQLENARAFESAGAAMLIEEQALSGRSLAEAVLRLLADREKLSRMGEAARAFGRPDAAKRIAELLFEAEATAGNRA